MRQALNLKTTRGCEVRAWGAVSKRQWQPRPPRYGSVSTATKPCPDPLLGKSAPRALILKKVLVNFLNEQIYLYDSSGLVPASQTETCIREDRGKISVRALFHGCLAAEVKGAPPKIPKGGYLPQDIGHPTSREITLDV